MCGCVHVCVCVHVNFWNQFSDSNSLKELSEVGASGSNSLKELSEAHVNCEIKRKPFTSIVFTFIFLLYV